MYYLYFLHSDEADKYYLGHSENPWQRLLQHASNDGSKFTGSYHDWKLIAVFRLVIQKAIVPSK